MTTTKTKEMLVKAVAPMDDMAIATDMLLSAKSAVRTYAIALTETATPEFGKSLKLNWIRQSKATKRSQTI